MSIRIPVQNQHPEGYAGKVKSTSSGSSKTSFQKESPSKQGVRNPAFHNKLNEKEASTPELFEYLQHLHLSPKLTLDSTSQPVELQRKTQRPPPTP